MTTFNDREQAFEAHFAFETELEFRVGARRDRLLAQWAGGLMGFSAEETDAYVVTVVRADLREAGDQDVHDKVLADLAGKGVKVAPHEGRDQLDRFTLQAREDLGGDSYKDRVV
jgi:hypothetical protein